MDHLLNGAGGDRGAAGGREDLNNNNGGPPMPQISFAQDQQPSALAGLEAGGDWRGVERFPAKSLFMAQAGAQHLGGLMQGAGASGSRPILDNE